MKKILRFAVVISIIFSMLGGNVAVLAAEVLEMQNENTAIVETPSTDTTETTPTEQSDGEVTNEKAEETTEDSAEEKTEETTNVTPEEKTEDETSTEETSNVEENTTVDQTVVEEENVIEGEEAGNTGYTTMSMNPESGPTIFEESSNKGNGRTYSLMSNLPDRDEPDGLKGSLELKIDLRLPQQKLSADSVKVTLTKEGGKAITSSEKETGKSNEKQLFYVFNDLDPSENYSLKIEGKGYQTYEASGIEVKANTTTNLEFSNGYDATAIKLDPVTGKTENLGPGVVRVGDVDGSGDVTQSDIDAILNKIEGKSSETGYNYNLNQDKDDDGNDIVDIIDLSYAAINKTSDYVTVTPRFITNLNLETVKPIEPTSGSYYSGTTDPTGKPDPTLASDITEVLASNDKHVTLQPNDTKAVISGDNPIEVGIEIEENTAEAKYINIAPSSNPNNNITDGTITVDGYDYEQDKAVELVCEIEKRPDLSRSASADLGNREKLALKVLKVYAKSENGTKADQPFKISAPPPSYEKQEGGKAYVESDGSITVDFGSQIAIKRVVIN